MVRLKSIELVEIQLPLKEAFQISSGTETTRRIFLLNFKTRDGLATWSECVAGAAPNYSPEAIDTAWLAVRDWVAPRVLDLELLDPTDVHPLLERDFRGHRMAKAAVEMAVWELFAQQQEVPLAKLIGGIRDEIATGISLGIHDTPELLVDKVKASLDLGYRKIKMKIKPGRDLQYVSAVRDECGDKAPLMVDANNAYTLDDIELLLKLDKFDFMMIEQPLAWDDVFKHGVLQQEMSTPICLDESITNLAKAEEMLALGSGRIINIKAGRVGGFAPALMIHDFCAVSRIPVWCGGMLESGVGRAYNVALASLPNFMLPGDVSPSARYWQQDIVTPEWRMNSEGMVKVPLDKVGMGVTVNQDRIDNLAVRREVVEI